MSAPKFDLLTIFPSYFAPLQLSLIGKAEENGLVDIAVHDLRVFAEGAHKSVDDTPYGGGAGMVMSAEPWGKAIDEVATLVDSHHELIVLTPAGERFNQGMARELSPRTISFLRAVVMKE